MTKTKSVVITELIGASKKEKDIVKKYTSTRALVTRLVKNENGVWEEILAQIDFIGSKLNEEEIFKYLWSKHPENVYKVEAVVYTVEELHLTEKEFRKHALRKIPELTGDTEKYQEVVNRVNAERIQEESGVK